MTKEEAVAQLNALEGDQESTHGTAENILCEYLRTHRAGEVATAFKQARDRVGFWYA